MDCIHNRIIGRSLRPEQVTVVDFETWFYELIYDINEAAEKGENFDLHMERELAAEVVEAYNACKWIEIY